MMPIYYGNKKIETLYYNNKPIESAYYGSTLVYESFKPQTIRFDYTGAVQTWTVPKGCRKLIVDCVGAAGGTVYGKAGGLGGRIQCNLTVSPNQNVYIYVGGAGQTVNSVTQSSGGFNGGGDGQALYFGGYYGGSGGGGSSDIRLDNDTLYDRQVVAGGGGGTAFLEMSNISAKGGSGGGLTGEDGVAGYSSSVNENARGGKQNEGGTGYKLNEYPYTTSPSGQFLYGGSVISDGTISTASPGGGAGYYGGGAGYGNYAASGGGGSSYASQTLCTDVIHTQGYSQATGNGWIIITTSK